MTYDCVLAELEDQEHLALLYSTDQRFNDVEHVCGLMSELTQNAITLLRYTRSMFFKAGMYENHCTMLDLGEMMIESGVSEDVAEKIARCFESYFDFDATIGMLELERLEILLIKQDLMQNIERGH